MYVANPGSLIARLFSQFEPVKGEGFGNDFRNRRCPFYEQGLDC
jgi:hypothetical protein